MTEKRFVYGRAFAINSNDSLPCITDRQDGKDYVRMSDLVDLLNEQQDIIFRLQDLCGESDAENIKLKEENASLKQRIRDVKYNNCD